jgi:hypothetical protein
MPSIGSTSSLRVAPAFNPNLNLNPNLTPELALSLVPPCLNSP